MSTQFYVQIEGQDFYESQDGPFRSLHLSAEGSTIEEMELSAHISEIDQDGGERGDYPLSDTGGKKYELAMALIRAVFQKAKDNYDGAPECGCCDRPTGSAKCDCGPRAAND